MDNNREISPQEKRLIEREFIAREAAAAKRRTFARRAFLIGISAGIVAALLSGFRVRGFAPLLLYLTWGVCILCYVGPQILPQSFVKDADIRWHLNPWQEALRNLSEGRRQLEAIALLAGPVLLKMAVSFIYMGLK